MAEATRGAFLGGAGMVWRRQRVVWLLFFATLFLTFAATRGLDSSVAGVLDHSAYAAPSLVHGFDLSAIIGLAQMPSVPLRGVATALAMPPVLFALFMLFATGGILAVYTRDARLTAGPFFEACGEHFWRFVRLEIYFFLALLPVGILAALSKWGYQTVDAHWYSPYATMHYVDRAAAAAIVILALLFVRLWFDMAQVIAVSDGETAMHRALRAAARVLCRNFFPLYRLFLGINILCGLGFGFGLYVWMEWLAPESIVKSTLLAQALILFWIGMRLWERASESIWYNNFRQSQSQAQPAIAPTAAATPYPDAAPQAI